MAFYPCPSEGKTRSGKSDGLCESWYFSSYQSLWTSQIYHYDIECHYLLVYLTDGGGRVYVRTWPNYVSPELARMQFWYPSGRQAKWCVLQPWGSPWVFHSFLVSLFNGRVWFFKQCLTNNGRQPPFLFLKRAHLLPLPGLSCTISGGDSFHEVLTDPEHSPEKLGSPVAE